MQGIVLRWTAQIGSGSRRTARRELPGSAQLNGPPSCPDILCDPDAPGGITAGCGDLAAGRCGVHRVRRGTNFFPQAARNRMRSFAFLSLVADRETTMLGIAPAIVSITLRRQVQEGSEQRRDCAEKHWDEDGSNSLVWHCARSRPARGGFGYSSFFGLPHSTPHARTRKRCGAWRSSDWQRLTTGEPSITTPQKQLD